MKQKILAMLMIIAVLLCFMPTMAFADAKPDTNQIGDYYAVDDAQSGKLDSAPSLKAGATMKAYEETQELPQGQVRINKTIAPTAMENVFNVTLEVTTEDIEMQTVTSEDAAVVLVIDTSVSMSPSGNNKKEDRMMPAKQAAQVFINNFVSEDPNAARKVAIVKFSGDTGTPIFGFGSIDGAKTMQPWTDAKTLQRTGNSLCDALNNLKPDGGTNLEAGIQLAKNLLKDSSVSSISNKNIVVLTDGKPTFRIIDIEKENGIDSVCSKGSNMSGYGNATSKETHKQVESLGNSLKNSRINAYAVFLGDEKLMCKNEYNCYIDIMSGHDGLATKFGFTSYTATDVTDLAKIFKNISEQIKLQAQAWILTDPMGDYIDCLTKYTAEDNNSGIYYNNSEKTLSWDLKQATPVVKENKKTYTLTYQIKLDNLANGFEAGNYYAANKVTSLTYLIANTDSDLTDETLLKTAYFNVPSVKGLAGNLEFTKVDETGQNALAGAKFTLTAVDNTNFVLTSNESETDGKITFTNIPSGHTYTLKEITSPAGYAAENDYSTVTVSYGAVNAPDIKADGKFANQPAKTSVSVTKAWNDGNNQDGLRPESVTVQLYADSEAIDGKTITLNAANNWTASFAGLDAAQAGKVINYTVKEVSVPTGYTEAVTGNAAGGYTITNTHTPETVDISGSKTWNDDNNRDQKRPEAITIKLLANGTKVDSRVVSADAEGNWTWTFSNKPKYDAGNVITYSVTEDAVENYTQSISGYNVTNTYAPEKTSITITKSWNDKNDADEIRPETVGVKIYANNVYERTVTLNSVDNWTITISDLPKNADGTPIIYTIEEVSVDGYTSVVTGDAANGFTITNTHEVKPKMIELSGKKIWDDNDNAAQQRPSEVVVNVYENTKNGKEWVYTTTLTEQTGWTWYFSTPVVNEDYTYTVEEEAVDHYNTTYIKKDHGYDIKNTYVAPQPKTGSLQLSKVVNGYDPTTSGYNPLFTITGPDNYSKEVSYAEIKDGPMTISGLKTGTYTVTESKMDVSGYTRSTSYNVLMAEVPSIQSADTDQNVQTSEKAQFAIVEGAITVVNCTNTYTQSGGYDPSPSYYKLTLTKQVVGLDTIPADYAVTVTINNQYGTVRTVTLKANETKTIDLLYGNYTLTETAPAVEGYTQSGQTFSENNFTLTYGGKNVTVTNTYTKDAEKPPVDPKPTDPKPTDPVTPVEPNKPDENPNGVPKTGDDMPISLAIYGIIAAGALLGIRKAAKRETK